MYDMGFIPSVGVHALTGVYQNSRSVVTVNTVAVT